MLVREGGEGVAEVLWLSTEVSTNDSQKGPTGAYAVVHHMACELRKHYTAYCGEIAARTSNPRVGGSNPSGRTLKPQVRAHVALALLASTVTLWSLFALRWTDQGVNGDPQAPRP